MDAQHTNKDGGKEASIETAGSGFPWLLVAACAFVVALWLLNSWLLSRTFQEQAARGQFGDMFGAANALFSGLAFACLIYTVHLQRKELALQRQELIATRKELSRTAAAQEKSQRHLEQQVAIQLRAARIHGLSTLIENLSQRLGPRDVRMPVSNVTQVRESRDQYVEDLIKEVQESR